MGKDWWPASSGGKRNAFQSSLKIASIVTAIMAFSGPFGTYEDLSLGGRFAYWGLAVFGTGTLFNCAIQIALFGPWLRQVPVSARFGLSVVLSSLPAAGWVLALEVWLRPDTVNPSFGWVYLCVFGIVGLIGWLRFMPPFASVDHVPVGQVVFFDRLPADLGQELDSISVQDHYINVVTSQGSTMLHMRFSDAMEELGKYPGLQIHRSHWVAKNAIEAIQKDGRKVVVVTKTGRSLPVSRTYQSKILELSD